MVTCELIGPILNMNLCHLNLFSVKIYYIAKKQRERERIQSGSEEKCSVFDTFFFFFSFQYALQASAPSCMAGFAGMLITPVILILNVNIILYTKLVPFYLREFQLGCFFSVHIPNASHKKDQGTLHYPLLFILSLFLNASDFGIRMAVLQFW